MDNFKPNIYPVIYWGLMFGLLAGFVLLVMLLLSRYITVIWFPVFLSGVIWGGWHNYRRQKRAWREQQEKGNGAETRAAAPEGNTLQEIKEAARDITMAAREIIAEQPEEEAAPGAPPEAETPPPARRPQTGEAGAPTSAEESASSSKEASAPSEEERTDQPRSNTPRARP